MRVFVDDGSGADWCNYGRFDVLKVLLLPDFRLPDSGFCRIVQNVAGKIMFISLCSLENLLLCNMIHICIFYKYSLYTII